MFETFELNTQSFNFSSLENRSAAAEVARAAREILNDIQGSGRPSRLLPHDADNPWVAPHELTYSAVWNWYQRYYYNYWDEAQIDSIQASLSMRRDGGINELLRHRQLPTCALPHTLEADDPDDNEQVSVRKQVMTVIDRIPYLRRIKLALLEAIFYGKAGVQLVWGTKKIAGQNYVTVLKHKPVNGDKIVWDYDDTPGIFIYKGASLFQNPEYRDNIKQMDKGPALMLRPKWLRNKFIVHEFETSDTDYLYESQKGVGVHGTGMRDRFYWTWNMRMELLGWQLDALQRVGANGMLYAFYPTGDSAARSAVLKALSDLVQNNVAAFPKGMMEQINSVIGRLEPAAVGYDVLFQLMTYLDDIMRRGFLGQNLSSQSSPTGLGSGVADLQAGSFENIIMYDAGCLEETLDEQLVEPIFLDNLWQYKGKMVRGDDLPFGLRYKIQIDRTNVKDLIQAAQALAQLGVPLDMDNLRDMAGLSPPRSKATTLVMPGGAGGQTDNTSAMQSELGHENKPINGQLPLKRNPEQFAVSRRLHYVTGESKPLYIPVEGREPLSNWLDEVRAELANIRPDDLIAAWYRNHEVFVSLDSGTPIKVYRDLSNMLDLLCGAGKYKITVNRRPEGDGWQQIDSSKFVTVPEFYERNECGDSAGGFEPGNDCAAGGKGGGTATKEKPSKQTSLSKNDVKSKKKLDIDRILPPASDSQIQSLVDRIKKARLLSPKLAVSILGSQKPEHLNDVESFLEGRRKALLSGKISTRAIAKALMITIASQGTGARSLDVIRQNVGKNSPFIRWLDRTPEGRWFRDTGATTSKAGVKQFRPEDIAAGWFLTNPGRKALDNLEQGNFSPDDWREFIAIRKAFGDDRVSTTNVLGERETTSSKKLGLADIQQVSEAIKGSKGNPKKIDEALLRLKGISAGKIGFIKHFLGLAETSTVDAIQINFWLTGHGNVRHLNDDDESAKLVRDLREHLSNPRVAEALGQKIHGRMKELSSYIKKNFGHDVSQHILHHWLWESAKGEVVDHFGMYSGFSLYQRLFFPETFSNDEDCGTGKGGFQLGNRCASNRAKLAKRIKRERSKERQSSTRSSEQLKRRHARQHEKLSRRYEAKQAELESRHKAELEHDPHTNRNRHAVEKAVLNESYRKHKEKLEAIHEAERGFHYDTHKKEGATFREWLKSKIADASAAGFKHLPEMLAQESTPDLFSTLSVLDQLARVAHPKPSEAQKKAGNFRHGHLRLHGFDITIETPRGRVRSGVSKSGKAWSHKLVHHYGYIKRTESEADGDHIDVFVGRQPSSHSAFIINQVNPSTGKFDEHKVMLGFHDMKSAIQGYRDCYSHGWKGFCSCHHVTIEQLKSWIKDGDTSKPFESRELFSNKDDFVVFFAKDENCGTGAGGFKEGNTCQQFAHHAREAAHSVSSEKKVGSGGSRKAYILHAWEEYVKKHGKISLDEFKSKLIEANRERHLDLTRADLVPDHHRDVAEKSEAVLKSEGRTAASFHFIRTPESYERNECGDSEGGFEQGNTCANGGNAKLDKPPPYGKSKARFNKRESGKQADIRQATINIFKKPIKISELMSIAGSPDDSDVSIETLGGPDDQLIGIHSNDTSIGFRSVVVISRNKAGEKVLEDELVKIKDPKARGRGIGLELFGRQVENAIEHGFAEIKLFAARADDEDPRLAMNGYHVWPKFGLDGEIPERAARKLPENLRSAKTLQQLYMLEGGEAWWKENGVGTEMTMSLKPGSLGLRIWEAYRAKKEAQRASEGSILGQSAMATVKSSIQSGRTSGQSNPETHAKGEECGAGPPFERGNTCASESSVPETPTSEHLKKSVPAYHWTDLNRIASILKHGIKPSIARKIGDDYEGEEPAAIWFLRNDKHYASGPNQAHKEPVMIHAELPREFVDKHGIVDSDFAFRGATAGLYRDAPKYEDQDWQASYLYQGGKRDKFRSYGAAGVTEKIDPEHIHSVKYKGTWYPKEEFLKKFQSDISQHDTAYKLKELKYEMNDTYFLDKLGRSQKYFDNVSSVFNDVKDSLSEEDRENLTLIFNLYRKRWKKLFPDQYARNPCGDSEGGFEKDNDCAKGDGRSLIRDILRGAAPEQNIRRYIKKNKLPGGYLKIQGMEVSEYMEKLKLGGVLFRFPPGDNDEHIQESLKEFSSWKLPKRLTSNLKSVIFSEQPSKYDDELASRHGLEEFATYATATQNTIVFYNNNPITKDYLAHESAHTLAYSLWKNTTPPKDSDYADAMEEGPAPTAYGQTSPAEDFAESVMLWATRGKDEQGRLFRDHYPKRSEVIKRIMSDEHYKG